MKRIFISYLISMISLCALAQFSIDAVDEFTGDRVIATDGVVLSRGFSTSFVLNLKYCLGESFVGCSLTTTECYNIYGDKSIVYIKFSDGTVRKAVCYQTKTADYTILMGLALWQTSMIYRPEAGFIEDLANKDIIKYRYETSEGIYEKEVKPKKAKEFKKQAKAFLAKVNRL